MSLHEDVACILANTGYPYGLGIPPRENIIDEAINKILDAAVEEAEISVFSDMTIFQPQGKYDMRDFHAGVNAAAKAINKLRPEK